MNSITFSFGRHLTAIKGKNMAITNIKQQHKVGGKKDAYHIYTSFNLLYITVNSPLLIIISTTSFYVNTCLNQAKNFVLVNHYSLQISPFKLNSISVKNIMIWWSQIRKTIQIEKKYKKKSLIFYIMHRMEES